MNRIQIHGGTPLCGEVLVQGSKNGVLPLMAASILIHGVTVIKGCPRILDVFCMERLLESVGCRICWECNDIIIDATNVTDYRLAVEQVTKMRSSIILLGALLSRKGEASLYYPGGCVIGDRPIDIHLKALRRLGAVIQEQGDKIHACATKQKGTYVELGFPSVGATENIILASMGIAGITEIRNCAKEPEIISLCNFLKSAGACIEGAGTDTIFIEGKKDLHSLEWNLEADRIVAGTYLLATVATRGDIVLLNAPVCQMKAVIQTARHLGAAIVEDTGHLHITMKGKPNAVQIKTEVYPGFPTDLQSMLLVTQSIATGNSEIQEKIFNNRFLVSRELNRMGAKILIRKDTAFVEGNKALKGCQVFAKDLRGGAALILAGLSAQGNTFVNNIQYVERGYEDICKDLSLLGGIIRRSSEETKTTFGE